jgi:hypothetical protein
MFALAKAPPFTLYSSITWSYHAKGAFVICTRTRVGIADATIGNLSRCAAAGVSAI